MSKSIFAARAALFFLPIIVYGNAMDTPFHYDDFHSIVNNPHIRQLGNIPSFFVDPTLFSQNEDSAMFRPLLLSSFAINYAISDSQVWSYHLVTLFFHLGCVALAYGLGLLLLKAEWSALLAAALFAVHPLNSESINYISSRSEVMAVFFVLLGLWFYARLGARGYPWVCAAFVAGLLSKSIVIILPVLLLLWSTVLQRDLRGEKKLWLGLGAITFFYVLAVWKFLAKATLNAPVRPYDEQIWTQLKALVFYLKMMVWPSAQNVDHQFLLSSSMFDPIAGPALLFVASLLALAVYWRRFSLLPLFCLAFFCTALAPSSIVPLNVLVNEHRLYLPSVAFGWFVAHIWQQAQLRGVILRRVAVALAPLVLLACSVLTYQRNAIWQDALSLWGDAAAKAPLMARPHIYWGEALLAAGRWTEAEGVFLHVVRRDPQFASAYIRLGELYSRRGAADEAVAILERGAQITDADANLWRELAAAQRGVGAWEKSLNAYGRAVALAPGDLALLNNMGNTYQMLNRPLEALTLHRRALDIDAKNSQTWVNLGNAHAMLGQVGEALRAFERATELEPSFAGAWMNLGGVYEKGGFNEKALAAYERGAQLDTSYRTLLHKKRQQLQAGPLD